MDADALLDMGGEQLDPTSIRARLTAEMQRQIDARVAAWYSTSSSNTEE